MMDKTMPYIDASGNVVVPFNADPKYHFWNGGQPLATTLQELQASEDTWRKHTEKPYPAQVS